jgi:hypothetical protein
MKMSGLKHGLTILTALYAKNGRQCSTVKNLAEDTGLSVGDDQAPCERGLPGRLDEGQEAAEPKATRQGIAHAEASQENLERA